MFINIFPKSIIYTQKSILTCHPRIRGPQKMAPFSRRVGSSSKAVIKGNGSILIILLLARRPWADKQQCGFCLLFTRRRVRARVTTNFQTARRRLIHGLDIKAGGIVFEPGTKKMAAKNSNLVAQQHHDTASRIQLQRTEKGYFPIFCSDFGNLLKAVIGHRELRKFTSKYSF